MRSSYLFPVLFLSMTLGCSAAKVDVASNHPQPAPSNSSVSSQPSAPSPSATSTAVSPSNPAPPSLFLSGRFDANQSVSWPGASIRANFQGTSVSVSLNESGTSYWDVMIDGSFSQTLALLPGTNTYSLVSSVSNSLHTVELYRRSEALYGTTQFLGFDFGDGSLLATPSTNQHKLEFLGDSLTAGYGVECDSPTQTETDGAQNEHKSYASLVSQSLNAEHFTQAYSGEGVYWNYTRTDPNTFGVIYPQTHPETSNLNWTFLSYTPDLVWIMLGTNDWNEQSVSDPPPTLNAFENAYQTLLSFVRAQYPNAEIMLAVPPQATDDYPVGYSFMSNMQVALADLVANSDAKVSSFQFAAPMTFSGCDSHPNAAEQVAIASQVQAAIQAKMGW